MHGTAGGRCCLWELGNFLSPVGGFVCCGTWWLVGGREECGRTKEMEWLGLNGEVEFLCSIEEQDSSRGCSVSDTISMDFEC